MTPEVVVTAAAAAGGVTLARGTLAPNSRIFGPVVGRGPRNRVLYLTFDDGPNPVATERIIRVLERERVPATFFMVGLHAERFPDLARRVAAGGFGIGNHTYTHRRLALAGPGRTAYEIEFAHDAIERACGRSPTCFRAPHGYRNPFVRRTTARYGYRVFGWTLGVWDTSRPGAEEIRWRVRQYIRPGTVLLLHDGDGYDPTGDRSQTAEALPGILDDCRATGYELRSLDDLVAT
jgi:peptidoglycan-N-acetylglucosamine deacetylase